MARYVIEGHTAARDRISQLPSEILDHIMGLLPIQEAAKTAVLSRVWTDVWSNLSQLCFDIHFFNYCEKKHWRASKYHRISACFYVVNKVLLQHKGSIWKFIFLLSHVGKQTVKSRSFDLDQWLLLVTRRGVEEIHLRFGNGNYTPPGCIFSCSTIRSLHLHGVSMDPLYCPCTLPNATSLCFENVRLVTENLPNYALIVPKLENLSFTDCTNMFHFIDSARNLHSLTIDCYFNSNLSTFQPVNLDFRSIRTLVLDANTLKHLFGQDTIKGFSLNVEQLKISCFCVEDDDMTNAFLSLLCNCPMLCTLEISFQQIRIHGDMRSDATLEHFKKLQGVGKTHKMLSSMKLRTFEGSRLQMCFIKEMLACFPALEEVVIIGSFWFVWNKEHDIWEEISHFSCASPKVRIAFE